MKPTNPQDPEQFTVPPDGKPEEQQPRWRQDFPIDWPQIEYISRRDFAKFIVLTSLAFVVGQLWILAQSLVRKRRVPAVPLEVARVGDVPVGGAVAFGYPGPHDACVMVRLDEDTFVAYDRACTHLSCPVIPQPRSGKLHCPCHEGSFDLATGRPIAGPPRRPLPRIDLEIRNSRIYAVRVRKETV